MFYEFWCRDISGTLGGSDRSLQENLSSRTVGTFKSPPDMSLQAAASPYFPWELAIWVPRDLKNSGRLTFTGDFHPGDHSTIQKQKNDGFIGPDVDGDGEAV